jgi:hypothetical protein
MNPRNFFDGCRLIFFVYHTQKMKKGIYFKIKYTELEMSENKCNLCKADNTPFKCGKCLTVFYCSRECQKKDWKTHKVNCVSVTEEKKQVMLFFYKGILNTDNITQELLSDTKNRLGLKACEMRHSPQLKAVNPQSKAWWETIDKFSIPHLSETPYTIFFASDGKGLVCPVENYGTLEKDEFVDMRIGPLVFGIHRTEDDKYFITHILFVE